MFFIFDDEYGFGGNGDYVFGNWFYLELGFYVNILWDVFDCLGGGCLEIGLFVGLKFSFGFEVNIELNLYCVCCDFLLGFLWDMSGFDVVVEGMV